MLIPEENNLGGTSSGDMSKDVIFFIKFPYFEWVPNTIQSLMCCNKLKEWNYVKGEYKILKMTMQPILSK